MQRPTCSNVHVRTTADALVIMHAVYLNILHIVSRRLDSEERGAIASGSVYVWEERGPHSDLSGIGIERWTDGIGWGPSRVRDGFLFYNQKPMHHHHHGIIVNGLWSPIDLPPNYDPTRTLFTKQTYTAWVKTPEGKRKWHLIAYYIPEQVADHLTIDNIPQLSSIEVPLDHYSSARAPKGRPDNVVFQSSSSKTTRRNSRASPPTYLPYEPRQAPLLSSPSSSSASSTSFSPSSQYSMPSSYPFKSSATPRPRHDFSPISYHPNFSSFERSSGALAPVWCEESHKLAPLEFNGMTAPSPRHRYDEEDLNRFVPIV